jgi:hypothetical protein
MFSGIQEILVLVIIILLIFFIPRVLSRRQPEHSSAPGPPQRAFRFSGRLRAAIVVSIAWPLVIAAILQPWHLKHLSSFLYLGIAPVLLAWGVAWAAAGFGKKNNKP